MRRYIRASASGTGVMPGCRAPIPSKGKRRFGAVRPYPVGNGPSKREQLSRNRLDISLTRVAYSLPRCILTPAIRKEHRDSTTSLASKAATKVDDDEEGLRLRLEAIGMHVGANITERHVHPFHPRPSRIIARIFHRLCHGKTYFSETLESIKFGCKDLWTTCWEKQVDNLRTNHRVGLCRFPLLLQLSFRFRACMRYRTIHSNLSLGCIHGMAVRTPSSELKWYDTL